MATADDEKDAHDLAVAGADFEVIRTPAAIRAQRDDDAVMGAARPARRMSFERQAVVLHDPQHALGVHGRLAFGPQLSVRQRADAAIAIGRALVDNGADERGQFRVPGLVVAASGPGRALLARGEIGAGDAQRFGDGAHREASAFHDTSGKIGFFARAVSRASRRISTSIVFLPSRRSSSRTFFSRSRTCEAPTTSSSAATAA